MCNYPWRWLYVYAVMMSFLTKNAKQIVSHRHHILTHTHTRLTLVGLLDSTTIKNVVVRKWTLMESRWGERKRARCDCEYVMSWAGGSLSWLDMMFSSSSGQAVVAGQNTQTAETGSRIGNDTRRWSAIRNIWADSAPPPHLHGLNYISSCWGELKCKFACATNITRECFTNKPHCDDDDDWKRPPLRFPP